MSPTSRPADRPAPVYRPLTEFLEMLSGTQGDAIRAIYRELGIAIATAPGSGRAHQAWRGTATERSGYIGHITDCCNIATALYATLHACRPLPFTLEALIVVLLVHDIEKPARYTNGDPLAAGSKADRATYRRQLFAAHDLFFTPEQENALRFIEGEGDAYVSGERQQGPLAALASAVDLLSARLWHDHPALNDPWPGATHHGRLVPATPSFDQPPTASAPRPSTEAALVEQLRQAEESISLMRASLTAAGLPPAEIDRAVQPVATFAAGLAEDLAAAHARTDPHAVD